MANANDAKHVFWLGQPVSKRHDPNARADAKTDPKEHGAITRRHGFEDLTGFA
jgi:hypothetical protein